MQNYAFVPSNLGEKIEKAELVAWEQNTFNVSRGIEYASYEIFGGFYFSFFSFFFQFENSPITESYIYITRYYSLSRERMHKMLPVQRQRKVISYADGSQNTKMDAFMSRTKKV